MKRTTLLLKAAGAGAFLASQSLAVPNTFTGAVNNRWDPDGNWTESVSAGAIHEAFHNADPGVPTTLIMDVEPSSVISPYNVGSFNVLSATAGVSMLQMGMAAGLTSTVLNSLGSTNSVAALNAYSLTIGNSDGIYVGSPTSAAPVVANSAGFQWSLTGIDLSQRAWAAVTGTIGPGKWTVSHANVYVGFNPLNPGSTGLTGMPGIIDSAHTGSLPGASAWTIADLRLYAKQAKNLAQWTITDPANQNPTFMKILEYFEANHVTFSSTQGGYLEVRDPTATPNDATGLRIKNQLYLKAPSAPSGMTVNGPTAEVESLVVDPKGDLRLERGSLFLVSHPAGLPNHPWAPTRAEFGTTSAPGLLSYGFKYHHNDRLTEFAVDDRIPEYGARTPTIRFAGQSYIRTLSDPDIRTIFNEKQEMKFTLRNHLDIEGRLDSSPARNWFTGEVDLVYITPVSFFAEADANHEVIAADCCNIFFTDVGEPRCLKYWRSLHVAFIRPEHQSEENFVKLVDARDNYQPNTSPLTPEALYIRDALKIDSSPNDDAGLRLNGLRVYYGDLLGNSAQITGGAHARLIKTIYGDFDGDCDVDGDDYNILRSHSSPYGPSTFALGDFDGDCDIDLRDFHAFGANEGRTCTCTGCNPAMCAEPDPPSCPTLSCPPGMGPAGAGALGGDWTVSSMEEDAWFIGQLLVDYLSHERQPEAPDAEGMIEEEAQATIANYQQRLAEHEVTFHAVVVETVEWLDGRLDSAAKASLAAQISSASLASEMSIAADLAAEAAEILSD